MINFTDIENRLFEKLNVTKGIQISEKMGVTSARYGNWKSRNSIPYEEIISLCEKENINLKYILTGKKEENFINFKEENIKIIENLNNKEQEKIYYLLKKETIN